MVAAPNQPDHLANADFLELAKWCERRTSGRSGLLSTAAVGSVPALSSLSCLNYAFSLSFVDPVLLHHKSVSLLYDCG